MLPTSNWRICLSSDSSALATDTSSEYTDMFSVDNLLAYSVSLNRKSDNIASAGVSSVWSSSSKASGGISSYP